VAKATRTKRPIRETAFWRAYNGARYTILFYALLLTLLILPSASTIGLPPMLVKSLVAICLFAAVMPSATKRTRLIIFCGVGLLVVARFGADYGYFPLKAEILLIVVGLTGLAAAASALRFVVSSRTVDRETIYAALSTYLLAGMFFGQIYWSLEGIWPGSLVGPVPTTETISVYYSFITLATLGYGDFVPRTDIARGIATFEVIGGQLYLAVLVARLIGAFAPAEK